MIFMIESFYKFVGEVAKMHFENLKDGEKFEDNFLNVLLYKLLKEKGVKRKVNGQTIQLFYDKKEVGYNKDDPVTQICRSLVIDAKTLRIISMGVPKSYNLDDYKDEYPVISEESDFKVQEYPDGTMIVFCPELTNYDSSIMDHVNTESDTLTENEERVVKDIKISTRRKLGTGYFNNSNKSFADMFKENFELSGFDMNCLVDNYSKDYCFVFNVQHQDHRMITPGVSQNTLIKVYKTKSREISQKQFSLVISSLGQDTFDRELKTYFTDIVVEVPLEDFRKETNMDKLHYLQQVYLTDMSWDGIDTYVKSLDCYNQGICLVSPDGKRTKMRNPKYTVLRELKGHAPIFLEEKNRLNIFKLFWRLRQNKGQIAEFCKHFDKGGMYMVIFNDFRNTIHQFTDTVFKTYHALNVERKIQRDEVPWHIWPLLCDLHKKYREEKIKIYPHVVFTYINTMPILRVYERVFDPEGMKERFFNNLLVTRKETNFQFPPEAKCHECQKTSSEVELDYYGVSYTTSQATEEKPAKTSVEFLDIKSFNLFKLDCSACVSKRKTK